MGNNVSAGRERASRSLSLYKWSFRLLRAPPFHLAPSSGIAGADNDVVAPWHHRGLALIRGTCAVAATKVSAPCAILAPLHLVRKRPDKPGRARVTWGSVCTFSVFLLRYFISHIESPAMHRRQWLLSLPRVSRVPLGTACWLRALLGFC